MAASQTDEAQPRGVCVSGIKGGGQRRGTSRCDNGVSEAEGTATLLTQSPWPWSLSWNKLLSLPRLHGFQTAHAIIRDRVLFNPVLKPGSSWEAMTEPECLCLTFHP